MWKPKSILGQPIDVFFNFTQAVALNILSWLNSISPIRLLPLPPPAPKDPRRQAVSISGPGGMDRMNAIELGDSVTVGYNVREYCKPSITPSVVDKSALPSHCVIVRIGYFSVNYADICIRWGLYESALRYVGWPIVPGFDLSGVVEWAGKESGWKEGDKVFGFTMFGAYSTRCLVPGRQLLRRPESLSMAEAAAAPAVLATALHCVALTGFWPEQPPQNARAALVHSAAGGVGSMLVQVCRLCGFSPIVAVVGSSHKIESCKALGADHVIDKSSVNLWEAAKTISPSGYAVIFDANGVSTLKESFEHLAMCGRLVVYGFHSNLPMSTGALNPLNWLRMGFGMASMPHFDSMRMVLENKAILGFNLSFFAEEHGLIDKYMLQLKEWLDSGKIKVSKVTEFSMDQVAEAHSLIQSGKSVGKIVLRTPAAEG